MRTLRSRVGVAVVSKKLYAFGGYDGSARLSTVECFNPQASFYLLCRYVYTGRTRSICSFLFSFHFWL